MGNRSTDKGNYHLYNIISENVKNGIFYKVSNFATINTKRNIYINIRRIIDERNKNS